MATQAEVAEAFVNFEDSPKRASNFRFVTTDDGTEGWLLGYDRVVYAHREPLRRVEYYLRRPHFNTVAGYATPRTVSTLYNQQRTVLYRCRDAPGNTNIESIDSRPQRYTEYDDERLTEILE